MKLIKYIYNPKLFLLKFDKWGLVKLSDEKYIKLNYQSALNKKIDLTNPKTFNEKLQWLKLYDRKDIYTTMVDKYEVKKYVSDIIGDKYIIPTLGVYDNFDDINFEKLPDKFVIKCTHDSGSTIILKNKNEFNYNECRTKINNSLKHNFYYEFREWPYKNVKPKILIETYMEITKDEALNDYKLFCFNGKVKTILVCSNRNGIYKNTDFYDIDWNLMPFTRERHKNNAKGINRPQNLKEMIEIAEKLSENIPFVRVDLYEINGKIYFGELTFYPSGGFEGFEPEEWDYKLGDMLDLSVVERKKDEK